MGIRGCDCDIIIVNFKILFYQFGMYGFFLKSGDHWFVLQYSYDYFSNISDMSKYILMLFFYFLKIIFDISTSK